MFDYKSARKAGYSDAEIQQSLRQHGINFDLTGARKAGFTDEQIIQSLNKHSNNDKLFTKEDPKLIFEKGKELAEGFIPGLKQFGDLESKQYDIMMGRRKDTGSFLKDFLGTIGKTIGQVPEMAKSILMVGPRLAGEGVASVADLFSGGKTTGFAGQPSAQEEYRGNRRRGGGKITSAVLPAFDVLLKLMMTKGMVEGGKGILDARKSMEVPPENVGKVAREAFSENPTQAPGETPIEKAPQEVAKLEPKPPGYYGSRAMGETLRTTPDQLVKDLMDVIKPKETPIDAGTLKENMTPLPKEMMDTLPKEVQNRIQDYTPLPQETIDSLNEVVNKIENRDLAMKYLEKTRQEGKEPLTDTTTEVVDNAFKRVKPESVVEAEKLLSKKGGVVEPKKEGWLKKRFSDPKRFLDWIFQDLSDKVRAMSPAGEKLYKLYQTINSEAANNKGIRETLIKMGFPKMTPKEQIEFVKVVEQGKKTTNPTIIKAAKFNDWIAKKFAEEGTSHGVIVDDATGRPITIENYLPHVPNEAGRKVMMRNRKDFIKQMAETNNMTPEEFTTLWQRHIRPNRIVKAGFEKTREFKFPPKWQETDPVKIWSPYNRVFSKRVAIAKYFGPKYKLAEDLASRIGAETGNLANAQTARDFIDRVVGRDSLNFEDESLVTRLIKRQVHTKLTPLTTLANIQQGTIVNSLFFGERYAGYGLIKAFTKEGRAWSDRIGVTGEGFYTDYAKANKLWAMTTGFPLSEDFNFRQVATASKLFFEDSFKKLQKNPKDAIAAKYLDKFGVEGWRKSLEAGKPLTESQLAKGSFNAVVQGVFPKLAANIPEWATKIPLARATYLFAHYQLHQPKLLASMFKFGKWHGLKAVARAYATAGILGEVPADMYALAGRRKRSKNPLARFTDNALTVAGPGWIYQLAKDAVKSGGYKAGLFELGGPIATGFYKTGGALVKDVGQSKPGKFLQDLLRGQLRGDLPIGPEVPSGALLERLLFRR